MPRPAIEPLAAAPKDDVAKVALGCGLRPLGSRGLGSRLDFIADPIAQPGHGLWVTGDERLPLGFRQRDGDDALAVSTHGHKDT